MGDSNPLWISFQYERMPIFCYWCGLINHDEKNCKLWTESGRTLKKDEQQYGPWLRASTTNLQQPQVVKTKSTPTSAPPANHRPTLSPSTNPNSPPTTTLPTPSSKLAMTPTTTHKPTLTNKEILSNPNLFRTHIADIDHSLKNFPNSDSQPQHIQLAQSIIADTQNISFHGPQCQPLHKRKSQILWQHPHKIFPIPKLSHACQIYTPRPVTPHAPAQITKWVQNLVRGKDLGHQTMQSILLKLMDQFWAQNILLKLRDYFWAQNVKHIWMNHMVVSSVTRSNVYWMKKQKPWASSWQTIWDRLWLLCSTVRNNEYLELELLRAWEPRNS